MVDPEFSSKSIEVLDPYYNLEFVHLKYLRKWVQRYKRKQSATEKSLVNNVRANSQTILLASASLANAIESKLVELKEQKPNSPEAIASRDAAIASFDALKTLAEDLQKAVVGFLRNEVSDRILAKNSRTFAGGVAEWWTKDSVSILSTSYGVGVYLSAVSVCSLLGVNPNLAAVTVAVLMRGRAVAAALKNLPKAS